MKHSDPKLKKRLAEVKLNARGKLTLEALHLLKRDMRQDYGPGDQWTGDVLAGFGKRGLGLLSSSSKKNKLEPTLVFWSDKRSSPHLPSVMVVPTRETYFVKQGSMFYTLDRSKK